MSRKTEATQIRIEMKEYSVFIIQKNYFIIINLFDSIIKYFKNIALAALIMLMDLLDIGIL